MDDFEDRLNVLENFKKINQSASTIVKVRRIEKDQNPAIDSINFETDGREDNQNLMSCLRPALVHSRDGRDQKFSLNTKIILRLIKLR